MNKSTKNVILDIGSIKYLPSQGSVAFLTCESLKSTFLSLILQDKLGRAQWEKRFPVDEGKTTLELPVSGLNEGTYYVWIEAEGRTFIRSFKIPAKKSKGWPGSLRSLFG